MKGWLLNIIILMLWRIVDSIDSASYLWDLKTDPTESTNLYDDDSYDDVRTALTER